jgi:hypothetical protein
MGYELQKAFPLLSPLLVPGSSLSLHLAFEQGLCAIIFADKTRGRDLPPRRSPCFVLECGEGMRLEFGLPFFGFF